MDGRTGLAPGTVLKLETATGYTLYTINQEIGRGGSCIVYDASYTDNLGFYKLVRIKECYPRPARIRRSAEGILSAETRDMAAFAAAKNRLTESYRKNQELFSIDGLTNSVSNTSDIYEANGTVYIVSVYVNGRTFSDYQGDTLHDCVALMLSTAKVLKHIHDAGYLYLDLKPDNILTLKGSLDLVQLFDFDSLLSAREIEAAIQSGDSTGLRASYSKGYAPLEQQTGKTRQLGKHSDLFSLGAVLFYALWHKTPSAFDCDSSATYDFSGMTYSDAEYQDALFPELTAFFHKTLASYTGDRYQDAEEAISQLKKILLLSDETRPWLRSSFVPKQEAFYGRRNEIAALADLLKSRQHDTVSLYGMGGIGKSTLARQYLAEYAADWDAVIWLYDQGDLPESIADDVQVPVNTVGRIKGESKEEYLRRKIKAISALAHEQRILLVLDNFDRDHLEQLKPFRQVGWTVLLISRERMPEGMFPEMCLREMDDESLARLFEHFSHCDLSGEENRSCFDTIADVIEHHTLLTELIARQVAQSYLDLRTAEAMLAGEGLSELPTEKIDYVRDQTASHETLPRILDRLAEIDRFSERELVCLKLLSLFDVPGIEADLFRELAEPDTLDFVNELDRTGWVKKDGQRFYLHPVMQEYVRAWAWTEPMETASDRMMRNLYERIRPAGTRHDGSRQFPEDYDSFYRLIRVIPQMIDNAGRVSEASQRLLFRWLMDAPVDQDTPALFRMLALLEDPRYLDPDSVLRLYETAAYYRARLYLPEDAKEILQEMRQYLRKNPSMYYLSAYHRAMSVILHNECGDLKTILHHEDRAIAFARLSRHPEAKKQLAACMMNKARTLMSVQKDQEQVRRLIREAVPIVQQHTEPLDDERYQFVCNAAMCFAMDGDMDAAQTMLEAADAIVYASPDSDLSVAEHLIEEVAPIRMEMGQSELAEAAVRQAISLCDQHSEALRYRETAFDAAKFLGRIYAMDDKFIPAEAAYDEAEKRLSGTMFEYKLPLCPAEVREKAEEERKNAGRRP